MSVNTKMKAIADEVRELSGTSQPLGLDAMASNLGVVNDEVDIQTELLAMIVAALEAKFGCSSGDSAQLPAVGASVEDCTWAQIKAISEAGKADEYFNLGDIKTITLTDDTVVSMQIVAFDADEKVDGSGNTGITWISEGVITTHNMNSAQINDNGWVASEMRTWLQGDFYNTLPVEVKNVIVPVNKTYYDCTTKSTLSCEDNVWIPSYREVFGNSTNNDTYETSGVDYTGYFCDNNARIKYKANGYNPNWWLRSAYNASPVTGFFCGVSTNGSSSGNAPAYNSQGVVLGFCM